MTTNLAITMKSRMADTISTIAVTSHSVVSVINILALTEIYKTNVEGRTANIAKPNQRGTGRTKAISSICGQV